MKRPLRRFRNTNTELFFSFIIRWRDKRIVHKPDTKPATLFKRDIASCVEIKYQLDATEVFIADLIACSTCFGHHYAHHQELKSIIQWLLPELFRAVVFNLLVWCGAEG